MIKNFLIAATLLCCSVIFFLFFHTDFDSGLLRKESSYGMWSMIIGETLPLIGLVVSVAIIAKTLNDL